MKNRYQPPNHVDQSNDPPRPVVRQVTVTPPSPTGKNLARLAEVYHHEDDACGLCEQIKHGLEVEKKLEENLDVMLERKNFGADLQRINLIATTIKILNEQAKGYKDNGMAVPAWIVAQIKDLENEEQAIFKARKESMSKGDHPL